MQEYRYLTEMERFRALTLNAAFQDPALNILCSSTPERATVLTELCALDKQTRPLRSSRPCGEVWLFTRGAGPLLRLAGLKGCEEIPGRLSQQQLRLAMKRSCPKSFFFFLLFFTGNCLFSVKGRLR